MPILAMLLACALGQAGPARPADPGIQRQLDQLAATLADSLAHPSPRSPGGDWVDGGRYYADIELAAVWPRSEFREPLLGLLGNDDPDVVELAAQGLLNYGDAALRSRVEAFSNDTRSVAVRRRAYSLGDRIERLLARAEDSGNFEPPESGLVSLSRVTQSALDIPGMTVTKAASELASARPAMRILAFCWLDRQGVIVDTSPLEQTWLRLTNDERAAVLGRPDRAPRAGTAMLRPFCEKCIAARNAQKLSDEVIDKLLTRLALMGSRMARPVALETIAAVARGRTLDSDGRRLLQTAFVTIAACAQPLDLDQALGWARSKDSRLHFGGLYVLACIDDPRAVEAVTTSLVRGETPDHRNREPNLLAALRTRAWPDPRYRWHYLRTLSHVMGVRAGAMNVRWRAGRQGVIDLHTTLTALSPGPSASERPRLEGFFAPWEALNAARDWGKWVKSNDPDRISGAD